MSLEKGLKEIQFFHPAVKKVYGCPKNETIRKVESSAIRYLYSLEFTLMKRLEFFSCRQPCFY